MSSSSRGVGLGTVIVVSAITSALVSAGVVIAIREGWGFETEEEVPELVGLSIDAARGVLDARGLRLVQRGERHDESIAAGLIAEQQPGARSIVPSGTEVTVLLSLGEDLVAVPDVIGVSPTPARARLINAGLQVAEELRSGGEGEPNTVSSTTPSAGERVARGTEVVLTVVPIVTMIAVPDLTGTTSRVARETIEQAGLTVGRVRTAFDDRRPPFVVLRQTPAAGTEVEPGAEVELVVNEE